MVRLTVLYGTPANEEEFLEHYRNVHVPLVGKMPKVSRFTWGKGLPGMDGGAPPYYLNAELCWASPEDMAESFGSPEGQATAADVANLAAESITMMVSEGN